MLHFVSLLFHIFLGASQSDIFIFKESVFFRLVLNKNKVLHLTVVCLPMRDEAVSTQPLGESADGSLVQQSQSSTQFFAH